MSSKPVSLVTGLAAASDEVLPSNWRSWGMRSSSIMPVIRARPMNAYGWCAKREATASRSEPISLRLRTERCSCRAF